MERKVEARKENGVGSKEEDWKSLGLVNGSGTGNTSHQYSFLDHNLAPGIYSYRIEQIDQSGVSKYSGTVEVEMGSIPKTFALFQNFPNPFNPSTNVRFDLRQASVVRLQVYNLLGQKVYEENLGEQSAGSFSRVIEMSRFASGVYVYRLVALGTDGEKFVSEKKMMLMKWYRGQEVLERRRR